MTILNAIHAQMLAKQCKHLASHKFVQINFLIVTNYTHYSADFNYFQIKVHSFNRNVYYHLTEVN